MIENAHPTAALESLDVTLLATGCSNLCRHCSVGAQQKHPIMTPEITDEVLECLKPLRDRVKQTYVDIYFDVFDHPQTPEVLEILWRHACYDAYEVIPFDAYPRENEEAIITEVEGYKNWIVHRPDLDMSHLVAMTKMQLWTLKPAHERK